MDTAEQLARSMAKWCKDPSTILAACKNSFSRGIPKRSVIEALVAKHHAPKPERYCEDFNDNGEHWQPRSLVKVRNDDVPNGANAIVKDMFEGPRKRDYICVWHAEPSLKEQRDFYNPFLVSVGKIHAITDSVARDFGLTGHDLRGSFKGRRFTVPRFLAYKLALDWGYSTPQIGRAIGGRDHSTVLHGIDKLDVYMPQSWTVQLSYARHLILMAEARVEIDRRLRMEEAAA